MVKFKYLKSYSVKILNILKFTIFKNRLRGIVYSSFINNCPKILKKQLKLSFNDFFPLEGIKT